MTELSAPPPGNPYRPQGPRDPGDAWVEGPDGHRFWGRFGAAGLLAHDPARGILLQHRAEWSHFGGTWGLPGGARHQGESALHGAFREANEEAGVPEDALVARFASLLELGYWSYTTVVARVSRAFEPVISDPESIELRWVGADGVAGLPLHPGFETAWPALRAELDRRIVIVVDAANVVGSRANGWWKDRRGAAETLAARLGLLAASGVAASALGLPQDRWWPELVMVVEGQARDAVSPAGSTGSAVRVVRAARSGDEAIVEAVRELRAGGAEVTTVTSDRELRARVEALGATSLGAGWLLTLLESP